MPSAVMYFYSGPPMHFYSGVDTFRLGLDFGDDAGQRATRARVSEELEQLVEELTQVVFDRTRVGQADVAVGKLGIELRVQLSLAGPPAIDGLLASARLGRDAFDGDAGLALLR